MRKLLLFMHISLDGFAAGPNGEMDWIKVDEAMFDFGKKLTDEEIRQLSDLIAAERSRKTSG